LAAKRPDFAQKSEKRQAEAKEKALKSTSVSQMQMENFGRTIASWKKARSMNSKGDHTVADIAICM
jgi:hypothetical protein